QLPLAPGATADVAIKQLSVDGDVVRAQILAGYRTDLSAGGVSASIVTVSVGRDWVASDLVAGAGEDDNPNPPHFFADDDDEAFAGDGGGNHPFARIGSVAIKGIVAGSAVEGYHFGFVAQKIGSFRSRGFVGPLTSGLTCDVIELSPATGDVTIREV